jgi:hypothetical protein
VIRRLILKFIHGVILRSTNKESLSVLLTLCFLFYQQDFDSSFRSHRWLRTLTALCLHAAE